MELSSRMREGLVQVEKAGRGEADYVPVSAQLASHTIHLTKVNAREFLTNPELFVRLHLLASEYYELDTPSMYYDLYNIEAEALGQKLIWPEGEFPEIEAKRQLVQSPADLDRLRPPDPAKDGRMPVVREIYKRLTGLGYSPAIRFCAPFSLAANVRGLTGLLMDIIRDPSFAHRLFTFLTEEVLCPWVEAVREACGVRLPALGADALASPPITSPRIMEEFAFDYILRMEETIGKVGVFGWWGESHLARPEELFRLKNRANPRVFYGLDPDVGALGPEVFRSFARAKGAALILGLDCSLLGEGPEEAIVSRVEEYVREGEGGLTLFLNAVPPGCPPAHVLAAVRAAHYYGQREGAGGRFENRAKEPFGEWVRGIG